MCALKIAGTAAYHVHVQDKQFSTDLFSERSVTKQRTSLQVQSLPWQLGQSTTVISFLCLHTHSTLLITPNANTERDKGLVPPLCGGGPQ